jgi:enoyl-CoA hydratase/carnithine racemase
VPDERVGDEGIVLYEVADGVATLTFNRPEANNGWNIEMEERYFALLDEAEHDDEVRAVVVTAAGRHFCPGLDLQRLAAKAEGVPAPERSRPVTYPLRMPKPMVCAINGTAAGIGLVHAAVCDIRFAAAGARMATSFTRRGLVAEHLLSWLLPRMVGHTHASDLLLSGRVFTAEEALSMGFLNRVVPAESLLDEAQAYARDLAANCSPLSMAQVKGQLLDDWLRSRDDSLAAFEALKEDPRRAGELAEGVASFREKRPPRFAPLSSTPPDEAP